MGELTIGVAVDLGSLERESDCRVLRYELREVTRERDALLATNRALQDRLRHVERRCELLGEQIGRAWALSAWPRRTGGAQTS